MRSLDTLIQKLVALGTGSIIALSPWHSTAANEGPALPYLPGGTPVSDLQTIPSENNLIKNPALFGTVKNEEENFSFSISWPELSDNPSLLIKWPGLQEAIRKGEPILGFGNVVALNDGAAYTYHPNANETKHLFLLRNAQTNAVRALDVGTHPPSVHYLYPEESHKNGALFTLLPPTTYITVKKSPTFYVKSKPQPALPARFDHQYHVNALANLKYFHQETVDDLIKNLLAQGEPDDAIRKEVRTYFDREKIKLEKRNQAFFDDPYEYSVYIWAVTSAVVTGIKNLKDQ